MVCLVLLAEVNNNQQIRTHRMILDTKNLVKDFGGVSKLSRQLAEIGYPITADGIQKWRRRGTIAGKWLIALSTLARNRNQRFDLSEYIKEIA